MGRTKLPPNWPRSFFGFIVGCRFSRIAYEFLAGAENSPIYVVSIVFLNFNFITGPEMELFPREIFRRIL